MPTNHTPNYQLSQWERDDRILMEDFNTDNAKIDAALASQAETLTDHAAVLAKLSNCRVHFTSYVGNGICDLEHSPRIPLPGVPNLLIVSGHSRWMLYQPESGSIAHVINGSLTGYFGVGWDGSTAILQQAPSNESKHMNSNNVKYYAIAIYAAQ